MTEELAFTPVTELSDLIAARRLSPVELLQALLNRIDRYDGALSSYITVCREQALAEARLAETEIMRGERRGPLHGIPVAHKDNIWTAGIRTTAHSRALADFVPAQDATVIRRLRESGAILLGKANTAEFATGGAMDHFGFARNPWDPEAYCGASSSGSAVAIAAGLAVAATGSDTGGSIRYPSSVCGIVGMKATYGRVSRFGLIPLSHTMDHIAPMTRTVADAALMLTAMSGFDPLDPTTSHLPVPDFRAGIEAGIRGLKLGIPREHFYENLDPEVEGALKAALAHLESLGARLSPVDLPSAGRLSAAGTVLVSTESFALHRTALQQKMDLYGPRPRRSILAGAFFSAPDHLLAQQIREAWVREIGAVMAEVDALVTPTLGFAPFPIRTWFDGSRDTSCCTRHFNMSGLPALTLPCGFTRSGMPIGMQIVARAFDEGMMFRVAHAYEQTTGWHKRRPDLAWTAAGARALRPEERGATPASAAGSSGDPGADLDWIRREAARLGLPLLEEDLAPLAQTVGRTRAALFAAAPPQTCSLEPPVWFVPPGSPPGSIARHQERGA